MQYVVYKITCNSPDVDHLYVGSTQDLKQRKRKHKYHSKRETNTSKLYTTIRAYDGFDNWTMEVVESGTCDTDFEIKSRERFYYDQLQPSLNMCRPQASKEERRLDHIVNYEQNTDRIKEYERQYRLENKDKMKGYNRQYRIANKDKLKESERQYKSQLINCDACNCECRKDVMSKHNKTKIHLKNLELNKHASKNDL